MLPVVTRAGNVLKKKDLKESLDVNLNKIGEKFLYHYSIEDAFKNATNNVLVMAESQQFLQYSLRKRLTNE